jgi:hypothetical protein
MEPLPSLSRGMAEGWHSALGDPWNRLRLEAREVYSLFTDCQSLVWFINLLHIGDRLWLWLVVGSAQTRLVLLPYGFRNSYSGYRFIER